MAKEKKEDSKSLAQLLYVQHGLTQSEVAEKIGVDAKTVSKWAVAGNWVELRKITERAKSSMLENLYLDLESIEEFYKYTIGTFKEKNEAKRLVFQNIKLLQEENKMQQYASTSMAMCDFARKNLTADEAKLIQTFCDAFVKSLLI